MLTDDQILKIAADPESCPINPWDLKYESTCGDVRASTIRFARAIEQAANALTSARLLELEQIERRWAYQMQNEFAEYTALRARHPQRSMIPEYTFEQYVQHVTNQVDSKIKGD